MGAVLTAGGPYRERRAGVRLEACRTGFALMLAWLGAAMALVPFMRETHCRHGG